jgi:hypothetical protein
MLISRLTLDMCFYGARTEGLAGWDVARRLELEEPIWDQLHHPFFAIGSVVTEFSAAKALDIAASAGSASHYFALRVRGKASCEQNDSGWAQFSCRWSATDLRKSRRVAHDGEGQGHDTT